MKEGKDEVDVGEALREENEKLSARVQQLAKVRGRGLGSLQIQSHHL